jgi:hypothetical protein
MQNFPPNCNCPRALGGAGLIAEPGVGQAVHLQLFDFSIVFDTGRHPGSREPLLCGDLVLLIWHGHASCKFIGTEID